MNELDQVQLLSYGAVSFGKHLFVLGALIAAEERQQVASLNDLLRLFEVPVYVLLNLGLFINHMIRSLPLKSLLDIALCSLINLDIRCLRSG